MIYVRTVCVCDSCGVSAYCDTLPDATAAILLKKGWTVGGDTVACPDCGKKKNKETQEA